MADLITTIDGFGTWLSGLILALLKRYIVPLLPIRNNNSDVEKAVTQPETVLHGTNELLESIEKELTTIRHAHGKILIEIQEELGKIVDGGIYEEIRSTTIIRRRANR